MLTEIKYKTFSELLDSVKLDLKTLSLESEIDAQDLIKVALRVNYDLGLRLNPSCTKMIEIHEGKGKLPLNFYVMNYALICDAKKAPSFYTKAKTYTDGVLEGVLLAQKMLSVTGNTDMVKSYSTVIDVVYGHNLITHNLNTKNILVQAFDTDDSLLSFDVATPDNYTIDIISQSNVTLENIRVTVVGGTTVSSSTAFLQQEGNGNPSVVYNLGNFYTKYERLIPVNFEHNKATSREELDLSSSDPYTAHIKNGYIVPKFVEGAIYINYQGELIDDDGNLLVMDHPLVNEYYEYALKQRIYENLIMSGENVTNMLNLIEARYRTARNNALSFINMPDFSEMKKMHDMNRKAQNHLYYNMFKSKVN